MGVYHYPITQQLIQGLPQIPYRNGVGVYEGVVIHYTCNEQDTAASEVSYESRTFNDAFVHYFVDANGIIQCADTNYLCYGCGGVGNPRFVQIEMCHADTQGDFETIFDMTCELAASILSARKLGVTQAKSDGSGTLWGHMDVTMYLGGTDHTDPLEWIQRWGKTWQDVIDRVTLYYNGLIAEQSQAPAPTPVPQSVPAQPKTPIFGIAVATVDQIRAYLHGINPNAPDYAQLYLDIGAKYGVRGDIAFCQSIKETNAWTFKRPDGTPADVSADQNNFAGIGAVGGGAKGATFTSPAQGIEAQIEHLYGYATTNDLPAGVTVVDPRFTILNTVHKRGVAPNWEDLDGKWADPGVGYGESVVKMWNDMCAIKIAPTPTEAELATKWVTDNNLIHGDENGFDPNSTITREELAMVLYRFAQKIKLGV